MTEVLVDVVIPLHDATRDFLGAVRSASSQAQGVPTRVTVVLHGLNPSEISSEDLLPVARVLHCEDAMPSPSGPRNVGLEAATAPFVAFLDSDDRLAPNCLRLLYEGLSEVGADVALPSIRTGRSYIGSPLSVSRRPRILDVVRDDLFSRSHCFGLIRRNLLTREGLRFPDGIRTGQDLVFMSQLYSVAKVASVLDAVYELREHGGERVTTTRLPQADHLAAVREIMDSEWVVNLDTPVRDALMGRIVSTNLASGWRRRRRLGHEPSASSHREALGRALTMSPDLLSSLSVRDRATIRFDTAPSWIWRTLMSPMFAFVPSSLRGVWRRRGALQTQALRLAVRYRPRPPLGP